MVRSGLSATGPLECHLVEFRFAVFRCPKSLLNKLRILEICGNLLFMSGMILRRGLSQLEPQSSEVRDRYPPIQFRSASESSTSASIGDRKRTVEEEKYEQPVGPLKGWRQSFMLSLAPAHFSHTYTLHRGDKPREKKTKQRMAG